MKGNYGYEAFNNPSINSIKVFFNINNIFSFNTMPFKSQNKVFKRRFALMNFILDIS
jgi:hypothetical protein